MTGLVGRTRRYDHDQQSTLVTERVLMLSVCFFRRSLYHAVSQIHKIANTMSTSTQMLDAKRLQDKRSINNMQLYSSDS